MSKGETTIKVRINGVAGVIEAIQESSHRYTHIEEVEKVLKELKNEVENELAYYEARQHNAGFWEKLKLYREIKYLIKYQNEIEYLFEEYREIVEIRYAD